MTEQTRQRTPLRIGIVGTNFVSDWLAEAASAVPAVSVTAVCSRSRETGDAFSEKHGGLSVYTDYAAFCRSDEIDAAYIATPNSVHAEQAVAALRAGKHVFCEKVLATSAAEFRAVRETAEREGKVLLEAIRPAYDPALRVISDALQKIGTVRRAELDFSQYSSRYDRFRAGVVLNAFDPGLGNAAVMDLGVYPIHVCVKLFGAPARVQSSSVFLSNGFEGEGTALLAYGTFQAVIRYSKIAEGMSPNAIIGEAGTLFFDRVSTPKNVRIRYRDGREEAIPTDVPENNMIYEVETFARTVLDGEDPSPYLDDSEKTVAVIDEIRRQNGIVFPNDGRIL